MRRRLNCAAARMLLTGMAATLLSVHAGGRASAGASGVAKVEHTVPQGNRMAGLWSTATDLLPPPVAQHFAPPPARLAARPGAAGLGALPRDGASTTVTIGTGTSSDAFPMGAAYHDQRTQVIYGAGDIGIAGDIEKVEFYVDTTPGQVLCSWTVRFQHTTRTSYTTASTWDRAGWTTAFSGDWWLGSSTGWCGVALQTPFFYNGTSHLLADFSFDNNSPSTDGLCRYTTTRTTLRTLTGVSNSADGDPLTWSSTTGPSPVRIAAFPNVRLTIDAYPTITHILPSSGYDIGVCQITDLAGRSFDSGATVKLTRSGQPDIAATDVVVVSATKITCRLPLTGAGPGAWDVVVTNPDGHSGTLPGGFTVTSAPTPTMVWVNDDYTGPGNCGGHYWQYDAFNVVQDGIDAVAEGGTVEVIEGTYTENINFSGKAVTVRSQDPHNPDVVAQTIIDGGGAGSVVTFDSGEGSDSQLLGLTIQNGKAEKGGGIYCELSSPTISRNLICYNESSDDGGGIYSWYGEPEICENDIYGNRADGAGGGICSWYCEPEISENDICDNYAYGDGDGICCYESDATICGNTILDNGNGVAILQSSSTITGNDITDNGSGVRVSGCTDFEITGNHIGSNYLGLIIYPESSGTISTNDIVSNLREGITCIESSPSIEGNVISGNGMSGIYCYNGSPVVSNCIISENTGPCGAGILIAGTASSPTVTTSTICRNATPGDGGAVHVLEGALTIHSSIIAFSTDGAGVYRETGATLSMSYCNVFGNADGNFVGGDPTGTNGNISEDPLFANAGAADYHLQSTRGRWNGSSWVTDAEDSPCLDAGDPTADYSKEPLPNGARLNMGTHGNTAEASKSANRPPSVPDVEITPSAPKTTDDLTCTASGSTDPDGDTVTYSYEWYKDDAHQSAYDDLTTVPSSATAKDEVWECVVTPNDGTDDGPAGEDSVTIGNSAPTQPTVEVTPDSPTTDDDLSVSASGSTDGDGDAVTYSYEWYKDDAHQSAYDDLTTVPSSATAKDEVWECAVTPNDGTDDGAAGEDSVTIANSAPTQPTVDVTPDSPTTDDDLSVSASGSTDADGDTVTYSYEWYKDDAHQSAYDDETSVPSSATSKGEVWECVVTPNDGTDEGPTGEDSVTIGNSAPTQPTVDVTPDSPTTDDDLSVSASGSTDADGDAVTYSYEWYKDDAHQSAYDDLTTVPSSATAKDEVWECVVTPNDGTDKGPTGEDSVTIGNSAPRLEWLGTPGYLADGCDPQQGSPGSTRFTFRVKITDADGTPPAQMLLKAQRVEDGRTWKTVRTRALASVTGDWANGMTCEATTPLPNGAYRYRFVVRDEEGAAATGDPAAWYRGPKIVAGPQLWCTGLPERETDYLDPETGTAGETRFRFSVQCTDGEGDAPAPRRLEVQRKRANGVWGGYLNVVMTAWGGGLRGGKYYNLSSKLRAGEYRYRFVFADDDGPATGSDSAGPDGTQWQSGPVVSEAAASGETEATAIVTSLACLPTADGAQITFNLCSAAGIEARILNIAGRTVRRVAAHQDCPAGLNSLAWNARADNGLKVPAGTYLVEIRSKGADGAASRAITTLRLNR